MTEQDQGSFGEELSEFAEQFSMCRIGQGSTELQSDAQRTFCAMLWEICPLKGIWPGQT